MQLWPYTCSNYVSSLLQLVHGTGGDLGSDVVFYFSILPDQIWELLCCNCAIYRVVIVLYSELFFLTGAKPICVATVLIPRVVIGVIQ
jgi:hypothetical protein